MVAQETFRALMVRQVEGDQQVHLEEVPVGDLPPGDVLVRVRWSSLNYKDGLAVTGRAKVIRRFPMVPGIDLAGEVVESAVPDFRPGDPVVLTGYGIGELHWGGYAQLARVRSEWLVPLPEGLTLQEAMAIGTAGFTAMLSVMALEEGGVRPDSGEVLVTGAAGGVGSVAVALLARLGYRVVAVTGRPEAHEYLRALGAAQVLDRSALVPSGKPLESARWAGAVDTVGGDPLAALLPAMDRGATVAACGNAAGATFTTTVFPFILRGVRLVGIDSVECPMPRRREAWRRLAQDLPREALARMTQVAPLSQVPELAHTILRGQVRGRVVIDVDA